MSSLIDTSGLDLRAPRTKQDYFARSSEQGLPNRCPILESCERRNHTIQLSRSMAGLSKASVPPPKNPVVIAIEEPSSVGGSNNFFASHLCPEVALFEPEEALPGLGGYPTTSGQYDKYNNPKYELLETGHFSECPEFIGAGRIDSMRAIESSKRPDKESNNKGNIHYIAAICTIMAALVAILVALYGDGWLKTRAVAASAHAQGQPSKF